MNKHGKRIYISTAYGEMCIKKGLAREVKATLPVVSCRKGWSPGQFTRGYFKGGSIDVKEV